MKTLALGVRTHSGWGALVAVATNGRDLELVDRRRIDVCDPKIKGASQPYHQAEALETSAARTYLAQCKRAAARIALRALRVVVAGLRERNLRIAGGAILLKSARPATS